MLMKGVRVQGVILIDSPHPGCHVPLSDSLINFVLNIKDGNSQSDIGSLMRTQLRMSSLLLGQYSPPICEGPYPRLAMLRSREAVEVLDIRHVPLWLGDRSDPQQAVVGWEHLLGAKVRIWDIPGNHFQPFTSQNVSSRISFNLWLY